MGGSNEKVVPPATVTADGKKISIGTNLRIHENTKEGKVHFHDDTAVLKVAIPTAEFFKRWREWRTSPSTPLVLIDAVAKTKLTLKPIDDQGKLDIAGDVSKIDFGAGFKALDDFAQGN